VVNLFTAIPSRTAAIPGRTLPIDQEDLVVALLRERVKLLAYVTSIVHDKHLAEDIFQDVATLALRRRDEIRGGQHLLAWIRLAARRRALEVVRERERYLFLQDETLLDHLEEQWAEFDHASATDLTEALLGCLEEMSPYNKTLVKLRYVDGLKGVSLAEAVDRSVNTVYVALTRIHRSLRDCIRRRLSQGGWPS